MTTDDRAPRAAADDDWLDRLLADDAAEHRAADVPDDGFTARVIDALPAQAALPKWRKPAVVALWSVAAAGFAVAMPSVALEVVREVSRLLAAQPVSLSGIAAAAAALAVLTWAGAAYSLRDA